MTAPGRKLRLAEAAERLAARRQARLLVLAGQEPLVGPRREERRVQRVLAHDLAPRVALVELRHRRVEGRAVDDRVVRREGHPQQVRELVLERAGEVVVDRVERERQRLVRPPGHDRRRRVRALEAREPVQRPTRPSPRHPAAPPRRAGPAPRARTATPASPWRRRSPRHGSARARPAPGSSPRRTAGAPPGAGSRPRAASRPPARLGAPAARGGPWPGSARTRGRAGRRPGTRAPSPCARSSPRRHPHQGRCRPWPGRRRPR